MTQLSCFDFGGMMHKITFLLDFSGKKDLAVLVSDFTRNNRICEFSDFYFAAVLVSLCHFFFIFDPSFLPLSERFSKPTLQSCLKFRRKMVTKKWYLQSLKYKK